MLCHVQEVLNGVQQELHRIRVRIFKLEQTIADADGAVPAGNEDKGLMLLDMLLGCR